MTTPDEAEEQPAPRCWSPEDDRWAPDEHLVSAVVAGTAVSMNDLAKPDRAWVVAHMKRRGYTAEQMADRLGCAVRSVRAVWSDAGVLVELYLTEREVFSDTQRMSDSEIKRLAAALEEATAERDRYRRHLANVVDTLMTDGKVTAFPCGCPRTKYNTYVAPKTGKAGCREHRRLAVARHRARRRERQTPS